MKEDKPRYTPSAGDKCRVARNISSTKPEKCTVLYIDQYAVVYSTETCASIPMELHHVVFSPLQTEEEKLIEDACQLIDNRDAIVEVNLKLDNAYVIKTTVVEMIKVGYRLPSPRPALAKGAHQVEALQQWAEQSSDRMRYAELAYFSEGVFEFIRWYQENMGFLPRA